MLAGMLAAAAAGALGAGGFVALLAAVVGGFAAWRVMLAPPWTPQGRAAWAAAGRRRRQALAGLARLVRTRRAGGAWTPPTGSSAPPWASEPSPPAPDVAPGTRVAVRCEVATERIQVWHSMATRRAYEVPPERGLEGAAPGTEAELVFERGRPRVVRRTLN